MLSGGIPPCNDPGTIDDETMEGGKQITEGKVEGRGNTGSNSSGDLKPQSGQQRGITTRGIDIEEGKYTS